MQDSSILTTKELNNLKRRMIRDAVNAQPIITDSDIDQKTQRRIQRTMLRDQIEYQRLVQGKPTLHTVNITRKQTRPLICTMVATDESKLDQEIRKKLDREAIDYDQVVKDIYANYAR